jgi:histidine phosphotransferase ChpT
LEQKIKILFMELLCSKLCHDLISSIGAINNGLEFLDEDANGVRGDAFSLIKSSARQASDRLTYYRLAVGKTRSADTLQLSVVQNLIDKLAVEKKIEAVWVRRKNYTPTDINNISAKLLLNLTLISFECLPRGGRVEFCLMNNILTPDIIIKITGEKCLIREDVKICLDDAFSEDLLTVQNILAFYCKKLAKICEQSVQLEDEPTSQIKFVVS